jgi:hypothetical protein
MSHQIRNSLHAFGIMSTMAAISFAIGLLAKRLLGIEV